MRRFKVISMTIIIVISSFTLSGCIGKEPNEIAYVVALGIDSAENDNYKITIQYANPTQISGGGSEEGGKAGSEIVENLVVEAPNIYAAIGLANQIDSKNFSLSHAKLIVFSQEVAKKGLKDITETFIRSEELRPDMYLAVALDEASKYLTSVKPVMEVNPAKYYRLIYDKNNLVGIAEGVAKNFFFGIETGDYDSLLPIAGVIGTEKESGSQQGKEQGGSSGGSQGGGSGGGQEGGSSGSSGGGQGGESSGGSQSEGGSSKGESEKLQKNTKQQQAPINESGFEYKMRDYIAGQSAVELKSESEAMGSAIFKGDKMVGIMGSIQTEIFKLLQNDYKYSYITFYNEKTPENPVTVKAIQEKNPQYDIDIDNKKIDIELFIESDIYSLPTGYDIEKDVRNFEANAEKNIEEACEKFMTEFLREYDCDIFHLNEKCKKKFLTNDEFNEFKNNVDYSDYDVNIKANFSVRRTGLVVRGD